MERIIQRAFKTELNPNQEQIRRFVQHAGAARFVYNLALERCQMQYWMARASGRAQRRPRSFALCAELTELKRSECPWLYGVSNTVLQNALRHLDEAYGRFTRNMNAGMSAKKAGLPRFKRLRDGRSFTFSGAIYVRHDAVKLPTIGWVRLKERGYLPSSNAHITSLTVSERAGRWYASVHVEMRVDIDASPQSVVGVDLGLAHLATLSDGTVIPNPRPLKSALRKLRREDRRFSRKLQAAKNGNGGNGKNREKQRQRVARVHANIANIRSTAMHQATTAIAKQYGTVVVEDLRVSVMLKNRKLARAISDAAWAEFRRQLSYKVEWRGGRLLVADRFFPSSKVCSNCGWKCRELSLNARVFHCASCGMTLDRDLNAAVNLAHYGANTLPQYMVAVKPMETKNALQSQHQSRESGQLALTEGIHNHTARSTISYVQISLWNDVA